MCPGGVSVVLERPKPPSYNIVDGLLRHPLPSISLAVGSAKCRAAARRRRGIWCCPGPPSGWTGGRIVAAIQAWAQRTGGPPTARGRGFCAVSGTEVWRSVGGRNERRALPDTGRWGTRVMSQNVETIRQFFEAMSRLDPDAACSLASEGYESSIARSVSLGLVQRRVRGRDGLRGRIEELAEGWPIYEID